MAFQIVAKRDSETVTMQRDSSLIALAKARVWASEGWNVTIVVKDDAAGAPAEESLFVPAVVTDRQFDLSLAG
jgi:hypothetical protein